MKIIYRQTFFTIVAAVLIAKNFTVQYDFIPQITLSWPAELRVLPPGYHIQSLKTLLNKVRIAGYYTDLYDGNYWVNPQAAVYLQRSQYALSPTILDIEHCFKYEYIVFDCNKPGCFRVPIKHNGYEMIYSLNDLIAIAKRK